MKCSIYTSLTLFALFAGVQGGHAQHHDRHWMGIFFLDSLYQPVIMGFEDDSTSFEVRQPTSDGVYAHESVVHERRHPATSSSTPTAVIIGVDYVVKYRTMDKDMNEPSVIAKLDENEELVFFRE
ncbi:MAG: hypothetical protein R2825_06050 [Saprospiraceae bacterium]